MDACVVRVIVLGVDVIMIDLGPGLDSATASRLEHRTSVVRMPVLWQISRRLSGRGPCPRAVQYLEALDEGGALAADTTEPRTINFVRRATRSGQPRELRNTSAESQALRGSLTVAVPRRWFRRQA
ncbi:hypothetical protein GCM10022254_64180 [Actinomadura meridiana]|uniref:Uncharacterized protein n=1 Tax=Actinomadura meridiana TaxID=559626 RepID=A0ABP8CKV0_9ACTN